MIKNNKFSKFFIFFALLILLFAGAGEGAFAIEAPEGATNTCTVRANVSPQEASEITGGSVNVGVSQGTTLALDGDGAATNAVLCTYAFVVFIATVLFVLILAVAVIFILLAAFYFITSGGNEEKNQKARKYIIYAIIGIIVASLAFVIPNVARTVIT